DPVGQAKRKPDLEASAPALLTAVGDLRDRGKLTAETGQDRGHAQGAAGERRDRPGLVDPEGVQYIETAAAPFGDERGEDAREHRNLPPTPGLRRPERMDARAVHRIAVAPVRIAEREDVQLNFPA